MIDNTKDSTEDFKYNPPQPRWWDNPVFMPAGSVRALIAMSVVGAFIAICVQSGNIEALAVIATMIAKDYFESKRV